MIIKNIGNIKKIIWIDIRRVISYKRDMNINVQILWIQTQALLTTHQNWDFFASKNNYTDLVDCLIDHNHLYYVQNNPIISDKEYDMLFQLLKEFESLNPQYICDYSPTQKLIWQYEIQKEFKKSNHILPILSLQNTYSTKDITERYDSITNLLNKKIEETEDEEKKNNLKLKIQNLNFLIEPKYDGLSIVLTYHDGKLYKAVTRGDGYTWDDVTENIKTIKNLPYSIANTWTIIVRGEVLMPKSIRKKINKQKEENWEEPFANTRNAAAWSLKLLDTNEVAKRWLDCYVYDIISSWSEATNTFIWFAQYLTPQSRKTNTVDEIIAIIDNNHTKEQLLQADIDFDGLVIKVIDPEIKELLGSTNHHPRRAIAYKFPAQQITTQIQSIERQIGRTGILTPVANLTPTELSWVTISRVSLHNRDFIVSKDIQVNDRVRLQRSGEVIPYIVGVIKNRRDQSQKKVYPDQICCPACHTPSQKIENIVGTKTKPEITTQFVCPNNACTGILKEQLKHFVSKNCMNIASIGESIIDMLVDQKILTSLNDIYTLTSSENIFLLKRLPGIADKKIDTFVDEINKSKNIPFWRLLNGLGISGIGIKLAKEISTTIERCGHSDIKNLDEIFTIITKQEFLSSIFGIGDKIIEELASWYSNPNHRQLLKSLQKHNIQAQFSNSKNIARNSWTICITGTFPLSRNELEYYITQAGFIFSPNLTKSVDYLLVGDHAGSKKDKIWPNTKIISNMEEIYTMLGISTPLFTTSPWQEEIEGIWSSNSWEMQSLFW